MNYKLLNFDHGYKHPESISIGPFNVEITEQHCRDLIHLPRQEVTTFGWNKDYNRVVKISPRIRGSWFETAEVIIDDKDLWPSVIFPETASPKKSSIDDLCLLLSFLSGRVVTLENDPFIDHLNPEDYTEKVIHYGYFSRSNFPWNNLCILRNQGIACQFYNLTMAYQSNDFVARAVHYNNALEVAYEKWYGQNRNLTMFNDEKLEAEVRFRIKECKECLKECFKEYNGEEETKNDIISGLGNICSPSAISKLKHFLRGIDLYPEHELPEMHKRLKWLNRVRNSMAHAGCLPRGRGFPDDLLGDITSSIIQLVLRINQYYFAKKLLGLDDPYLDLIKGLIMHYFYEGKFGGRSIFDEKYEEYMERVEKEWISGYN